MNSQECLIGPGTDFLADYKILLRADMDTFPTPRFRGFWPDGVLVDSHYSTNFNLRSIKHALKKVACEAGLEHKGLYNPGSTWYGDARRVRHMAKLTVALNKFGRASLFGPGTLCRLVLLALLGHLIHYSVKVKSSYVLALLKVLSQVR